MRKFAQSGAAGLTVLLPVVMALLCSERLEPAFSTPKLAAFLLIAAALGALALGKASLWRRPRRERWFWCCLWACVAVNLLSAWLSPYRWASVQSLELLGGGVLLVGARAALGGSGDAHRLHRAIAASAVLVALLVWLQWMGFRLFGSLGFWQGAADRTRLFATLGNPDFVATFLAAAMPALVALCVAGRRGRRLWVLAVLLTVSAAVLTGARGGVLALACGALLTLSLLARRRTALTMAVLLACAVAASGLANQRGLRQSLQGRFLLWRAALHGSLPSPLGSGPGSFAAEYPLRLGRFYRASEAPPPGLDRLERHAQNDFVEIWCETGWLGALASSATLFSWLALAVGRLRAAQAAEREALAVALATVLTLCVAGCFDFALHRPESWALLCLAMSTPLRNRPADDGALPRRSLLRQGAAAILLTVTAWLAWQPLAAALALADAERAEQLGNLSAARRGYLRALRWQSSSPDANFNLTRVLAMAGEDQAALEQSVRARRFAHEPELCLLRARILQNQDRRLLALGELQAGLQLFPYSRKLHEEAAALSVDLASPMKK